MFEAICPCSSVYICRSFELFGCLVPQARSQQGLCSWVNDHDKLMLDHTFVIHRDIPLPCYSLTERIAFSPADRCYGTAVFFRGKWGTTKLSACFHLSRNERIILDWPYFWLRVSFQLSSLVRPPTMSIQIQVWGSLFHPHTRYLIYQHPCADKNFSYHFGAFLLTMTTKTCASNFLNGWLPYLLLFIWPILSEWKIPKLCLTQRKYQDLNSATCQKSRSMENITG